jgi:hypothetical protein
MADQSALDKLIEYETLLLKKIIKLKDLYKFKSCLVKFGLDLKAHREYTIREFVWGFIKDPSLANEVAIRLEDILPDIRDEQPTLLVPGIAIKQPIGGIQYTHKDRYNEIKSKSTNENTLIIFQIEKSLYAMYYNDALIGRDLFDMQYNEDEASVLITEDELPDRVRTFASQEYDVVVFSTSETGDVRADHISSLCGQQFLGFQ